MSTQFHSARNFIVHTIPLSTTFHKYCTSTPSHCPIRVEANRAFNCSVKWLSAFKCQCSRCLSIFPYRSYFPESPKLLKVGIKRNAIFLSSPLSPTLRYWENIGPVLCCCFVLFACHCCCCFVCLFCKVNKLASAHFIGLKKKNTNKQKINSS